MHKYLIIQTAYIGDVVLATSVVESIQQHFPNQRIDVLVREGNETLFKGHPYIGRVWVWGKNRRKLRNLFRLIRDIRQEHYSEVINLQRYLSSGLLTVLSGADITRGFDKNPLSGLFRFRRKHLMEKEGRMHEIERNHLLIDDIVGAKPAMPRLYPAKEDFESVKVLQKGTYICCAPASVWQTKQYPPTYWANFISKVPAGIKIYLIGGPKDQQLANSILEQAGNKDCVNLCGRLSFLASAALMKGACMNYVNDSAPVHFASAMNAPVTVIYCSTVPAFGFGPLSDVSYLVQIDYNLYCRPCGLHGHTSCPEGHFRCAHDIHHKKLLEILNERRT